MDIHPDERRVVKLAKAVESLRSMLSRFEREPGDDAVRDAVIARFETAFELAWKSIRDWLAENHPEVEVFGAKSTLTKAFELGLVRDADAWSRMLKNRNLTTHTYDQALAVQVAAEIQDGILDHFDGLVARLA